MLPAATPPVQRALAEAFTICDNYHCSVLGPTNPNRLHMWTGMIDPAGTGGGPVIDNSPAFNNVILSWTTYPERLEQAGVSWKVYQEQDNFDDNSLAWFKQYANAPSSSPLRRRGIAVGQAGDFEPNISAWRRHACGDLTSACRFSGQPTRYPYRNTRLQLAATEAGLLTAQQEVNDNPAPAIPTVNQPLPAQQGN
jgi:phospholipase C